MHKGQVLAQLVDDDYRAAVAQAQAGIAAATAQQRTLQAQRELQQANIDAAHAIVAATGRSDRAERARRRATATAAAYRLLLDRGQREARNRQAQLQAQRLQTQAQAHAAERQLGVLDAQLAQSQAAIEAARAALAVAMLNLQYTTIVATQDGVLGQRQVRPGQLVGVGSQITTLTSLPNLWVIANYKETQLTHMAVGQRAEIAVDSFPGRTLRGHVLAFAPGSGAEFALLPPDNATGNFTKVVQRIPVKIAIDDADGLTDRLVPGMSVEARVYARERRSP